jgi:secreted trypsin-like serine protease
MAGGKEPPFGEIFRNHGRFCTSGKEVQQQQQQHINVIQVLHVDCSSSSTVSLRNNGSNFCGGSILSPLFVITTAECVHNTSNIASFSILAGTINLDTSSSNKFYQIRSIASNKPTSKL